MVSAFARLPLPGHGDTWERFEILASLAEEDLSLARLGEGHADALAILDESGRGVRHSGASYGVWAARTGTGGVIATPVAGGWQLAGRKPFCSGSAIVDRALITAKAPDGYRLFDIATDDVVIDTATDSWPAVGMADSLSETLTFGGSVVSEDDAVGPPGFYTDRPGFWFGACGVAACWYGGARGLVTGVVKHLCADPGDLLLAEIGRAASGLCGMSGALQVAATVIDLDPEDRKDEARARALALRQIVHDFCEDVLRYTAAAGGARPLCHDLAQARRAADLYVYLAQHHGAADATSLGRLIVEGQRWS
ncbi:MAG: acyl-CoA dehydrogenase [Acidimicrobiales bacterium]|nr:acyl-CoA dehydrogenase [Acidimicrobiales bacterium]